MLTIVTDDRIESAPGPGDAPGPAALASRHLALHRIQLVESGAAGRAREALMRATDLAAVPTEALHVTLGPVADDGTAWLALIDRVAMADHVARLGEAGIAPTALVPAALLLPAPDGAAPTAAQSDDALLLRGQDFAAMVAPAMGPAMGHAASGPAAPLAMVMDTSTMDAAPDLLSGAFAPRRRWWRDRPFQIAAGVLVLLAVALAAAPPLLAARSRAAVVAGHEEATAAAARAALGREFDTAGEAAAALAQARDTREDGLWGPRLTYLVATIAGTPGSRIERLDARADGALSATLGGRADAVNAARTRLSSGGFSTTGGGAEVLIGARRGAAAPDGDAVAAAMVQRINATADAAILARAAPPATPSQPLLAALDDAGLAPVADGAAIAIEAARPTVLLPLLSTLEARGHRFRAFQLTPNPDATLGARLEPAPAPALSAPGGPGVAAARLARTAP